MAPEITIITPVYNGALFVRETIESVLSQSFQKYKYILIDDQSDDDTPNILLDYAKADKRISIITNKENLGPLRSRNIGIELSATPYIAFIDADDIWPPSKLKTQHQFMKSQNIGFSYTDFIMFVGSNKENGTGVHCPNNYYLSTLFSQSGIALSSVMFRRGKDNFFQFANFGPKEKVGGYTEADLYLKLVAIYGSGHKLPEDLLYLRTHSESMSSNKIAVFKALLNFFNKRLKLNWLVSFMIVSMIGSTSITRQIKKILTKISYRKSIIK